MLAHKVDGENPASYSYLLLAAWKLKRWAEDWNPLPPKTATTSGLNVMHSQLTGNLFPSDKLKGNHTFTAWAMTIGNDEAGKDPAVKPDGEGETM